MTRTGSPPVHRPVLVEEVLQHLAIRPGGLYIDGTVGAGGHMRAILQRLGDQGKGQRDGQRDGRVLGIDRDTEALKIAEEVARPFFNAGRCVLHHGSYEDLDAAVRLLGARQVDGILLDLGVSSLQIDRPERGFSFIKEGPLDMRMDAEKDDGRDTAGEFVNKASQERIERVLREYGEEPHASRIAKSIVEARRRKQIRTTTELAGLIGQAIPRKAWPGRIHPATRTFQALRIAVNRELQRLDRFLQIVPGYLSPKGRLVILSYHSLEDRPVKHSFLQREREGIFKCITKKPVRPAEIELQENPRARSAKMRVSERVDELS